MAEIVEGKVSRLIPSTDRTLARLDTHGSRQFILRMTHQNYNAIYSLLLSSSVNRHTVSFRLSTTAPDDIVYMNVNFPQS